MAGNTSTKKAYASQQESPVGKVQAPKAASKGNSAAKYDGQLAGTQQSMAQPMNMGAPAHIVGLNGLHNDIGEMSGFITEGYLDKQGTPYGEAAKFNFLPPGMDIDNQENAEIHSMPLRMLTDVSYPGDGWTPKPRDVKE